MASLPVVALTKQLASGSRTRLARIRASRRCPGTRISKFFLSFFPSLLLLIRVLTSHDYSVRSVAWSNDGKLASGSDDRTIRIWSEDSSGTFNCQSTLSGHLDG